MGFLAEIFMKRRKINSPSFLPTLIQKEIESINKLGDELIKYLLIKYPEYTLEEIKEALDILELSEFSEEEKLIQKEFYYGGVNHGF